MAEDKRSEGQAGGASSSTTSAGKEQETGDPGRTPGSAEGDRETVEEDLKSKSEG